MKNMIQEEYWKDIIINNIDYTGLYQVSNLGNVRSLDRYLQDTTGRRKLFFVKGIIIKQTKTHKGYYTVMLSKDNIRKKYFVHRLVATMFIDNPDNLQQVNHMDECKTNNNVNNLEWCTNDYNAHYGTHYQRIQEKTQGRKRSKLQVDFMRKQQIIKSWRIKTIQQFDINNNLLNEFDCINDAKRYLNKNYNKKGLHIAECCKGTRNICDGFIWKYKE